MCLSQSVITLTGFVAFDPLSKPVLVPVSVVLVQVGLTWMLRSLLAANNVWLLEPCTSCARSDFKR